MNISIRNEAHCIWEANALLGEGPVWCADSGVLYWIDIKGRAVHRCRADGGGRQTIEVPEEIGCLAICEKGGIVAALRSGVAFLDLNGGPPEMIVDPEAHMPANRFNDGKCDRRGRLWVGTMDDAGEKPTGALYRLTPDLKIHKVLSGVAIANGLGWSPDDKTMYFTDSVTKTIFAFDYDIESGEATRRRIFVQVPNGQGSPDGMTVDQEGYVWSAHWDGWRITRYDPSGGVDRVISMPVPRPTSCMFGGDGLDRLFVTSAAIDLAPDQLAKAPLSGGLFVIKPGVTGLPEPRFAGRRP